QTRNEDIKLRANVEPSTDLKIQLDVSKSNTSSYQEIFRYDEPQDAFVTINPSRGGNYKVSFLSIRTAFNPTNGEIESDVFKEFEDNLIVIKNRFQSFHGAEFDTTSQDVVIPAFIAAYSGA